MAVISPANFNPKVYSSYSGSDIKATITMPGLSAPLTLGNLRTLSISTRRQVIPIPVIGGVNIRGVTRGARIIAGTLIFTSFNHYIFRYLGGGIFNTDTILADMIPPFDITITEVNEYGNMSMAVVRGVTIVDEGIVFSVDDVYQEEVHTFIARGYVPVHDISKPAEPVGTDPSGETPGTGRDPNDSYDQTGKHWF
jgi:hypothetical protein